MYICHANAVGVQWHYCEQVDDNEEMLGSLSLLVPNIQQFMSLSLDETPLRLLCIAEEEKKHPGEKASEVHKRHNQVPLGLGQTQGTKAWE